MIMYFYYIFVYLKVCFRKVF